MAKGDKGKKDKKGKKGGKPGAVETEKEVLTEVERTFYDLTIEDIKRKILRLRAHIQNLSVANESITQELRGLREERKGEAGELTNQVDEIHNDILKIRSENEKLTVAYKDEKRRSEETISDLELKYKAMQDQLRAEIKRLNGKLNACEEFRLNRDAWMVKFNERVDELSEKELEAKELFRHMEAKSVYERELLKDEMLGKLTLAGEEFTGAGSTNSSNLNLRLIRENIALQKNIDMLISSNNEMDERMAKELALYESNKAAIPALEKSNRILIRESQEKLNVIKNISDRVQTLKQEYISGLSYREQNISIKEFQICARFRRKKLQRQVRTVGQQLNEMENEVNLYEYLTEQYNNEREQVERHLETLRTTIESSIGVSNFCKLQRSFEVTDANISIGVQCHGNLLNRLVGLLYSEFDVLDLGRRASLATLKPYEKLTRFDQLFKKDAPSLTSLMDLCVAYIDSDAAVRESRDLSFASIGMEDFMQHEMKEYETILPAQRPLGRNYIFDVETGTSLHYSSELEDPERMEVEEGAAADGEEEEGSESSSEGPQPSSDDESGQKKKTEKRDSEPTATAAPSEKSGTSKLPPGTIVDVVLEEEEELIETNVETVETYDENEEYDINLFY